MGSPIFISYASIDEDVAETICNALQARGHPCWIACRDIGPDENFQESIVRAIRSARVMLLIFTRNANNSDEIKKEVVLAGRHRVSVLPVRVEDVVPNDAFAYEFATRQWIDLFKDWEREIDRLGAQIDAIANRHGCRRRKSRHADHSSRQLLSLLRRSAPAAFIFTREPRRQLRQRRSPLR